MSGETPFTKIVFPWRKAIIDDRSLSAKAKHIALTLANRMDPHGVCFPGVALISAETNRHERTVQKGLRELEECGYLHIEEGGGRASSSTYTALLPERTATPLPEEKGGISPPFPEEKEKGGISPPVAESPETPAENPETPAENPVKGGHMPPEVVRELDREVDTNMAPTAGAAHAPPKWTPIKKGACQVCDSICLVDGYSYCAECASECAA